jgi:hypothetical protein
MRKPWRNPDTATVPNIEISRTRDWMILKGWPQPIIYAASLARQGTDWDTRRAAQEAYEDILSAIAYEALHPTSGRFSLNEVANLAACAEHDLGRALYLLEIANDLPSYDHTDPRLPN